MKRMFNNINYNKDNIFEIPKYILLSFDFCNDLNINILYVDQNIFEVIYNDTDINKYRSHIIKVPRVLSYNHNNKVYKKIAQDELTFLTSLISYNELFKANWILAFLHELGHIYFWELYHSKGKFHEYCSICDSTYLALANINDVTTDFDTITEDTEPDYIYKAEMCYKYNLNESNAWNFAYIHFPRIWNMLKNRNLI